MSTRWKKKRASRPLQHDVVARPLAGRTEEKLVAGVPLPQLVPRTLVHSPELVVHEHAGTYAAEKFRRLRSLLSVKDGMNPQVIVITSPVPGEGKSLISMNLSLAFGGIKDGRALLIDADLRRPSQTKWLTPAPSLGLAELLQEEIAPEHAILQIQGTKLDVLPAGKLEGDPGDLLASNRMHSLVEQFRDRYVKVIIDTPPIIPFTDADITAASSDGVLLVLRTSKTKIAAMRQAELLLKSAPLLGILLNDQSPSLGNWAEKYNSYYNEYYSESRDR